MPLSHQRHSQSPTVDSATRGPEASIPRRGRSNADQQERLKAAQAVRPASSAASGGLHAGGCDCANCQGGGFGGVHAAFTHIGPDGAPIEGGATNAPQPDGSPAPTMTGPAEAATAGAYTSGRHPSFPAVYGQTWYDASQLPAAPTVVLQVERSWLPGPPKWTVTVRPVRLPGGPTWPVILTEANEAGYAVTTPHDKYPGYAHSVVVSAQAAANVRACEDQHVADLDQGWYLSSTRLAEGINYAAAAPDGFLGDSLASAKEFAANSIVAGLGSYGLAIKSAVIEGGSMEGPVQAAMAKAFGLSKSQRDSKGTHSFPLELYSVNDQTQSVSSRVKDDVALDATAAADIVTFETIV